MLVSTGISRLFRRAIANLSDKQPSVFEGLRGDGVVRRERKKEDRFAAEFNMLASTY